MNFSWCLKRCQLSWAERHQEILPDKAVRKGGELGRVWETGCLPSRGANVSCLEASDAQPLPGRSEPRDDLLT